MFRTASSHLTSARLSPNFTAARFNVPSFHLFATNFRFPNFPHISQPIAQLPIYLLPSFSTTDFYTTDFSTPTWSNYWPICIVPWDRGLKTCTKVLEIQKLAGFDCVFLKMLPNPQFRSYKNGMHQKINPR